MANGIYRKPRSKAWKQPDTPHITLVEGPPCAGKTTHVEQHAQPTDLIVDFDRIAQQHGSPHHHRHPQEHFTQARQTHTQLIRQIESNQTPPGTTACWIISANPKAQRIFPHHTVITLAPPIAETLQRLANTERTDDAEQSIKDWYQRRSGTSAGSSLRDRSTQT